MLVGIFLLSGCSPFSSDPKPIPDSTFTRLLTELHLAASRRDIDAPYHSALRDTILIRYGVRQAEFDTTLRYYSRHPDAFKTLYQSVVDSLKAIRPGRSPAAPPEGVPDSLTGSERPAPPVP